MSRASFGKREREQAKRDKAANKRERRQRAADEASTPEADGAAAPVEDGVSTADLLQMIEDVHRRHESGDMTDDDFETTKADLLGRLRVD